MRYNLILLAAAAASSIGRPLESQKLPKGVILKRQDGFDEGERSSLFGGGQSSAFFGEGAGDGLGDWTPDSGSSAGTDLLNGGTAAEAEGPLTESNPSLRGSQFRDPNSGVNAGQAAKSIFGTLGTVFGNFKFPDYGR